MTCEARSRRALCACLATLASACTPPAAEQAPLAAGIEVATALGGEAPAGFLRAEAAREFSFPLDHGAHDGFRTEWWYLTGTLADNEGRALGYQLTFFRQALVPPGPRGASRWRGAPVWMAHFAVTDVEGATFRSAERFAREAVGLAGAQPGPFRVHLEDWEVRSTGSGFSPLRLRASAPDFALDLEITAARPPILQGEAGLSRKGPEPGNASYYYSMTRLATRGRVEVGGSTRRVSGLSWLDREWSTSALGRDLVGWDWFALHLSDGRDLMLYRLRTRDGGSAEASAGTLIGADGAIARRLDAGDFELRPVGRWSSPRGGTYPARWTVVVPAEALELELEPLLPDQELRHTVRYWEGAVEAHGTARGLPLRATGYLEMTGYATPAPDR